VEILGFLEHLCADRNSGVSLFTDCAVKISRKRVYIYRIIAST